MDFEAFKQEIARETNRAIREAIGGLRIVDFAEVKSVQKLANGGNQAKVRMAGASQDTTWLNCLVHYIPVVGEWVMIVYPPGSAPVIIGEAPAKENTIKTDADIYHTKTGKYEIVHRLPIFGVGGDAATVIYNAAWTTLGGTLYGPIYSGYGEPTVQAGASRWYRFMLRYSDNSQVAPETPWIRLARSSDGVNISPDCKLPYTYGGLNGETRLGLSEFWQSTDENHANLQMRMANTSGTNPNNLGVYIKYIELIAYDKWS